MLYDMLTGVGRTLLRAFYGPRYKLLILKEITIVVAGEQLSRPLRPSAPNLWVPAFPRRLGQKTGVSASA